MNLFKRDEKAGYAGRMDRGIPKSLRGFVEKTKIANTVVSVLSALTSVSLLAFSGLMFVSSTGVSSGSPIVAGSPISTALLILGCLIPVLGASTLVSLGLFDDAVGKAASTVRGNDLRLAMLAASENGWSLSDLKTVLQNVAPAWISECTGSKLLRLVDDSCLLGKDGMAGLKLDGETVEQARHLVDFLTQLPTAAPDASTVRTVESTIDMLVDTRGLERQVTAVIRKSATSDARLRNLSDYSLREQSEQDRLNDLATTKARLMAEQTTVIEAATKQANDTVDDAMARLDARSTIEARTLLEQRARLDADNASDARNSSLSEASVSASK